MWDDLPKRTQASSKIIIIILAILTIGALSYSGYVLLKPVKTDLTTENSPTPSESVKISPSPTISPSASISPFPSPSSTPDYKVPEGETYVIASAADTNGDSKEEILVITKMPSGKFHAYILSSEGSSLFDNKELVKKPVRIAVQTYDTSKESYLSWMLVFTEQSGDLAFIHWNGTVYEIPQNELGI